MNIKPASDKSLEILLSRYSAEARSWQSAWEEAEELRRRLASALKCLHEYNTQTARVLLAEADEKLQALEAADHDCLKVPSLLRRQYWSEMAYLRYMEGDLRDAERCLDHAEREMLSVLERHSFLIVLAFNFVDFFIQRARIARREYRFAAAREQLDRLSEIYSGQAPVCILSDGRAISVADVQAFLDSLPYEEGEKRYTCHDVIGDMPLDTRMANLEVTVLALPDLVIPYP